MVKYDPVLGAFRTIDGGSQNGNTDTIFAGSGLLMCINETGFQTKWSPNFTINTNLSDVLFSVMQRFDNDEFANSVAHLDFVRRLDALEKGNSGGASNITVNDVSPDAEGNILLGAENIAFSVKDEWGDIIPTSGAISVENLQHFFASMQYAIFSVNGHNAYINPDNPEQVITDITIYGETMFLESPESETPRQDWDGNPLSQKTVYDLAYDVYTYSVKEISTDGGETYSTAENGKLNLTINCPTSGWVWTELGTYTSPLAEILDQLSRKSIRTINGMEVYDQETGDINLTGNDIPLRMIEDDLGNLYPDYTIGEKFFYMMGFPASGGRIEREVDTEYYADGNPGGFLIGMVKFSSSPPEGPLTLEIDGEIVMKIQPGASGEWQSFIFPILTGNYILRKPTPNVGTIWTIEFYFWQANN